MFYSCGLTTSESEKEFTTILEEYIEENPMIVLGDDIDKTDKKRTFAHPSYSAFFNKNEKETVLILKLTAHYEDLNINIKDNSPDSLIFNEQRAKGWYLFNNKPIIIFDSSNLSEKYISSKLNIQIPDSLKLQQIGNHLKPSAKVYYLN
jgi:hypothetical protein